MLGGKPTGGVSSRFVSQNDLDEAAKNRAASSGAGGEEAYDPRSLFEQLQAHKSAKDEEYDDMHRLSNQFRGIDEGESEFLSEVNQRKAHEERRKKQQEEDELKQFRQARHTPTALSPPARPANPIAEQLPASDSATEPIPPPPASSNKKKRKAAGSSLLGIVKKKPSAAPKAPDSTKQP